MKEIGLEYEIKVLVKNEKEIQKLETALIKTINKYSVGVCIKGPTKIWRVKNENYKNN